MGPGGFAPDDLDLDREAWPPSRRQWIAAGVGLLIAVVGIGVGGVGSIVLRLIGYPVASAAIVRWVPIVRDRQRGWFVAHELAMLAIVVGWLLTDGGVGGALVNGSWLVIAAAWWALDPRRRRQPA